MITEMMDALALSRLGVAATEALCEAPLDLGSLDSDGRVMMMREEDVVMGGGK